MGTKILGLSRCFLSKEFWLKAKTKTEKQVFKWHSGLLSNEKNKTEEKGRRNFKKKEKQNKFEKENLQ